MTSFYSVNREEAEDLRQFKKHFSDSFYSVNREETEDLRQLKKFFADLFYSVNRKETEDLRPVRQRGSRRRRWQEDEETLSRPEHRLGVRS